MRDELCQTKLIIISVSRKISQWSLCANNPHLSCFNCLKVHSSSFMLLIPTSHLIRRSWEPDSVLTARFDTAQSVSPGDRRFDDIENVHRLVDRRVGDLLGD